MLLSKIFGTKAYPYPLPKGRELSPLLTSPLGEGTQMVSAPTVPVLLFSFYSERIEIGQSLPNWQSRKKI